MVCVRDGNYELMAFLFVRFRFDTIRLLSDLHQEGKDGWEISYETR